MGKHISINKHEYNLRKVEELNNEIALKEETLKDTTGFINVLKLKHEIKKLYKQLDIHGTEVLAYEYKESQEHLH